MKLHSRVCDILNIEKPIVLAGMGGTSCPALAAAVSNAGGLDVLGAASCICSQCYPRLLSFRLSVQFAFAGAAVS